jgi:hypothetical protein
MKVGKDGRCSPSHTHAQAYREIKAGSDSVRQIVAYRSDKAETAHGRTLTNIETPGISVGCLLSYSMNVQ